MPEVPMMAALNMQTLPTTPAPKRKRRARKARTTDPSRPKVERWTLSKWARDRHAMGVRALAACPPGLIDDLREAHDDAGAVAKALAKVEDAKSELADAEDVLIVAKARSQRWIEAGSRFDALVAKIVEIDAEIAAEIDDASEPKP